MFPILLKKVRFFSFLLDFERLPSPCIQDGSNTYHRHAAQQSPVKTKARTMSLTDTPSAPDVMKQAEASNNDDPKVKESDIKTAATELEEKLKAACEDAIGRVTREAGRRIRTIKKHRDQQLADLKKHTKERVNALRAGDEDPGPLAVDMLPPAEPTNKPEGVPVEDVAVGSADQPNTNPNATTKSSKSTPTAPPLPKKKKSQASQITEDSEEVQDKPENPEGTAVMEPRQPDTLVPRSDLKDSASKPEDKTSGAAEEKYGSADVSPPDVKEVVDKTPELAAVVEAAKKDGGSGDKELTPEEELRAAEKALKEDPENPDRFTQLASVQIEVGQKAQGMINYLRAAEGYARTEQLAKSMQIYNMLVILQPNDMYLHEQMMLIALRLDNIDTALEKLKWISNEHLENGKQDDALALVDKVLALKQDNLTFINLKTDLLASLEMIDEACVHLAHFVGQFIEANRLQDAHILIEKGVEIAPENDVWATLRADIKEVMRQSGVMPALSDDDEASEDLADWISTGDEE
jgi:tetratricopeptide (TPR) repeat protein